MRRIHVALALTFLAATSFAQIDRQPPRQLGNSQPNNGPTVIPRTIQTAPLVENGPKVTFRSTARMVLVPVVVVDKGGRHISGLTKEDFEIKENGRPHPIAVFEEVKAEDIPVRRTVMPKGTFSNASVDSAPHRISVILIDTINTPFLDQSYGRQQVIQYLSQRLQPGEIVALLTMDRKGVHMVHTFTSDASSLIAAMKRAGGKLPAVHTEMAAADLTAKGLGDGDSPRDNRPLMGGARTADEQVLAFIQGADTAVAQYEQVNAIQDTLACFLEVAHALAGVPGRKALVWITGGFPFFLESPSSVPGGELSALYTRAVEAMNDANVAVYPVDARGLMNDLPVADASASIQANRGPSYSRPWLLRSTQDSLREFADMTGGRAFYNRNDLSTGIERANYDSGHYYMLGYYLEKREERPGWRKLKVKVRRKDAQARYRSGFFVTKATEDPELTRRMDVLAALQSPFDSTGLPILGKIIGAKPGANGKTQVDFGIDVPGTALLVDADAKNRLALEIVGIARTPAGVDVDKFLQRVESNLPDDKVEALRKDGLHYTNSLHLAPGRYDVRLLVRDNATGRLGTASVPIVVK